MDNFRPLREGGMMFSTITTAPSTTTPKSNATSEQISWDVRQVQANRGES
jgi:hypothetical protein